MRRAALTLAAALALAAPPARAAQCSVAADPVLFGIHVPTAPGPTDSTGQVNVTCTGVVHDYMMSLSPGGGGSYAQRRLASALGRSIPYQLFLDPSRTTIWGDGTGGSSPLVGSALKSRRTDSYPIYGRIPALQYPLPAPGLYNDTILVTISW